MIELFCGALLTVYIFAQKCEGAFIVSLQHVGLRCYNYIYSLT